MDDPAEGALDALGLPSAVRMDRVTTGHDADTWRIEMVDGRVVALRMLPARRDGQPEVDALRTASARGVPVPDVVATGRLDGRWVIVTSWCSGNSMGELLLAGGDPDVLGRAFGATQRELHRPAADGTVLCHLDFQPFNLLVDAGRVSGILDWANARYADARLDLATTRVILDLAASRQPSAAGVERFTAAWREGYAQFPADEELAPFLRRAADLQLRTWHVRVESGAAPQSFLDAARRVAETVW